MNIDLFGQRFIELLPTVIRGFARRESNYLSRGKITLPQFGVLELLSRHRQLPMNELARELGVSRPAATGLVDRLLAQGLVGRRGDTQDRRVIQAALTARGKRVLANIWSQKRRMVQQVFGRIPPTNRAQYLSIFEQVAKILQEPPRP